MLKTLSRSASLVLRLHYLRVYSHQHDETKSMISNIQACNRADSILQLCSQLKDHMMPRTYAIATRKLAYFCVKMSANVFDLEMEEKFLEFYARLMGIQCRLLSPQQCISILHFLKVSSPHVEDLSINKEQIVAFANKVMDQTLRTADGLNFNKFCDLYDEFLKLERIYGIGRKEDQRKILQLCLKTFPVNVHQEKAADLIFHISSLYMNLLRLAPGQRIRQLYILTCEIAKKLMKYYTLKLKITFIDMNIGKYGEITDPREAAEARKMMVLILEQICKEVSEMESEGYKVPLKDIKKAIKQIDGPDTGEVLIKLAMAINAIKKVPKTEKQLEKEREFEALQATTKNSLIV